MGVNINGKALADFGGASLRDYTVSAPTITSYDFQGVNRTSWRLLKQIIGRRTISISILFTGADVRAARLQMSAFNAACIGVCELYLPDGFFYDARLESCGEASVVGQGETSAMIRADYQFVGVQHDALKTVIVPAGGGVVYCQSTMPRTDCILRATVGATSASYSLGGAVFESVAAGDVLVFDGINGLITRNGQPSAATVSWSEFPSLTPGNNAFSNVDALTVQYYPTYL